MSRFLTVRNRLAGAFFLMILVLVSLTGLYLLEWTERYYVGSISDDLKRESHAIGGLVQGNQTPDSSLIGCVGRDLGHRITIIRADGKVLADSERDYRKMPNHSNRPEFRQAMATDYGTSMRYSATLKTRMLYVATGYGPRNKLSAVVRVSEPLSGVDHVLATIRRTFIVAGLVALLIAAVLSVRLASDITRPIEDISSAARRVEHGDLSARVSGQLQAAAEIKALASTFNSMAEQLQSNIQEVHQQSAQLQAVFDHSDNGLVLIGSDDAVRMINPAACRLLGIDCTTALSKTLIEGTLNHDLAGLVERVRRTGETAALDVDLAAREPRSVHAYVAPVVRPDAQLDILLVLHDVTTLRKLDTVRRDFVANVSHELRTPLASIKAMAETIVLRHASSPAAVPDFAASIVQETDRMTLLADDLLELTRLESKALELNIEPIDLGDLVGDVFSRLRGVAEKRSVSLKCEISPEDIIYSDVRSLGQIVSNLVDNAIKYTPEGGFVSVRLERSTGHIAIRVSDNGIGIPSSDLPRIFERFYRVDKGRSRESGGTGLGLAIVKHLGEQMGGKISVKSELGVGSTFSVILPDNAGRQ